MLKFKLGCYKPCPPLYIRGPSWMYLTWKVLAEYSWSPTTTQSSSFLCTAASSMPIWVVTKEVRYIHEISLTLEHSISISSPVVLGLTLGAVGAPGRLADQTHGLHRLSFVNWLLLAGSQGRFCKDQLIKPTLLAMAPSYKYERGGGKNEAQLTLELHLFFSFWRL